MDKLNRILKQLFCARLYIEMNCSKLTEKEEKEICSLGLWHGLFTTPHKCIKCGKIKYK